MTTDFELVTINKLIQSCINKASLGLEPINALIVNDKFVPKEGWLWDYKESINIDITALAKTILQIVSFHNAYGGYLIYGVKEVIKDKEFIPLNVDFSNFNPAQLRTQIQNYTGNKIDITFKEVNCKLCDNEYSLGIIHIPKRSCEQNPISFTKNGPEKKGKPIFIRDDVYYRSLDQCIKAKSTLDWQILFSPRNFDSTTGIGDAHKQFSQSLSHDLPERHLICSNFIGRVETMSQLWEWLSDEFEYTKILSGDGGKGKTSIAYEFCRSFIKSPPTGYERVVWLSIKEKQFSGIDNDFYELRESDFICSRSFLVCLGEQTALDTDDFEEISIQAIKKQLKSSLILFPSLIIVDDIDSLQEDEQRKVVDICRQLGSEKVRFLITTRKKLAYSSDLCIDIPGLPQNDYLNFVESLVSKHNLKKIRSADTKLLHKASDGSPLLTSSILRLYKQGIPLNIAIKEWSGHAGEDARNAAVKREIESLSQDAKRVLLIISYFKSCSFTELMQAAKFEKIQLVNSLEELQALFLVNEPRLIESEERFSISNTTALIISGIKGEMAFDFKKLSDTVKKMKIGPSSKKTDNRKRVGLAINQSIALLKAERYDEAIETIDNELRKLTNNPDLLLMKGRCLITHSKPKYEEARRILRLSVLNGQKKELAYELWYSTEENLTSSHGMIESSLEALKLNDINKVNWYERLARGYLLRSKVRSGCSPLTDMMEASLALTKSLIDLNYTSKELRHQEIAELNNLIWEYLNSTDISWLSSFNDIYTLINNGDHRIIMCERARKCLHNVKLEPNFSTSKQEAYSICERKLNKISGVINSKNNNLSELDYSVI